MPHTMKRYWEANEKPTFQTVFMDTKCKHIDGDPYTGHNYVYMKLRQASYNHQATNENWFREEGQSQLPVSYAQIWYN